MDWQTSLGGGNVIATRLRRFLKIPCQQFIVLGLSLLLAFSSPAFSCPALLFMDSLPLRGKYQGTRDQIRLYALEKNESGWYWRPLPLQLDPYDSSGRMVFPKDEHWRNGQLAPSDRLSFSTEEFSEQRYVGQYRLPCGATTGIEIQERETPRRLAYLMLCEKDTPAFEFSSPVRYEQNQFQVVAENYRYLHDAKNHLMFSEIAIKSGDQYHVVASNSDQLIRGDVRRFFTLNFDGHDIKAEIFEQRYGSLGLVGLLRFYLKILAFQLELSLTPEVQFFADALYMPMSLHIPVEAKSYLNPGSGIYYTWQSPPEVIWDREQSQIPAEAERADMSAARKFCQASLCRFAISGKRSDTSFALRFVIPRYLVELGFFPQLISDMELIRKEIKRPVSRFSDEGRIGFFFETSQLPKGNHDWDFWLHFGSESKECPVRVRLRTIASIAK